MSGYDANDPFYVAKRELVEGSEVLRVTFTAADMAAIQAETTRQSFAQGISTVPALATLLVQVATRYATTKAIWHSNSNMKREEAVKAEWDRGHAHAHARRVTTALALDWIEGPGGDLVPYVDLQVDHDGLWERLLARPE